MNQAAKRASRFSLAQTGVSFCGAIVAGTIWWAHRTHIDLPCSSGGGCDLVMSSPWATLHLFGHSIPLGFVGFLGYVMLLVLSMSKWASETDRAISLLRWAILAISAGGFCYSWYLQWVAHFIIGAFCIWCRTSACIMTVLFVITAFECLGDRLSAGKRSIDPETQQAWPPPPKGKPSATK